MLSSREPTHCVRTIVDPGHLSCGLPFTVDPYDANCPFGCTYCYAKDVPTDAVTEATIAQLGVHLAEAFESDRRGPWPEALRKRIPIRIGFLRDPFPAYEARFRRTESLLRLLAQYRYPCVVITKSDQVAQAPYAELLARPGVAVHLSVTTLDDEVSAYIEPLAPAPRLRLQALADLRRNRVAAFARVNPILPQIQMRDRRRECYTPELLDAIHATGAQGVIVGFLNSPTNASRRFQTVFPMESPEALRDLQRAVRARGQALGLKVSFCGIGASPQAVLPEFRESGVCCSWPPELTSARLTDRERLNCSGLAPGRKFLHRLFYSLISGLHEAPRR